MKAKNTLRLKKKRNYVPEFPKTQGIKKYCTKTGIAINKNGKPVMQYRYTL